MSSNIQNVEVEAENIQEPRHPDVVIFLRKYITALIVATVLNTIAISAIISLRIMSHRYSCGLGADLVIILEAILKLSLNILAWVVYCKYKTNHIKLAKVTAGFVIFLAVWSIAMLIVGNNRVSA